MKREVKLLRKKALDALLLSIELFNRPVDPGRAQAVLILLDHGFEMLLKAGILERGGRIRERRAKNTIGFDACVQRALNDGNVSFLSNEQALTLQMINGLRDAEQHYLLDIPEQQLYLATRSGVTLFSDILATVFGEGLATFLPSRVLPITTHPPSDLDVLVEDEMKFIRSLLRPGRRRLFEARARARSLAVIESTLKGEKVQPSEGELNALLTRIRRSEAADVVFPGITSLSLNTEGTGVPVNLRISKKEGIPVQLVRETTPGVAVVAVRRVDELGFYSLGRDQVAQQVALSPPKTTAVIWQLKIKEKPDCFKQVQIGKARFDRYSTTAVTKIREALPTLNLEEVWKKYRER
ncbi:MAG: hypothetical protein JWO13_1650 [Acidobacteriales bacterium]|nr:hypothetical protein [Terriglobales bacterium]